MSVHDEPEAAEEVCALDGRAAIEAMVVRAAIDALAASPQPFVAAGRRKDAELDRFTVSPSFFANIGFAGEHMRGCLAVLGTAAVIQAVHGEDATGDSAVRDILGELANLMLGRLKNQLIRRGVTVLLATPTTMSGRELQFSTHSGSSEWFELSSRDGSLFVRLEADFGGRALTESYSEADAPMDEGEMLLF